MARIAPQPSDTSVEYIRLEVEDSDLDFSKAQAFAKKAALGKTEMPMLLAWNDEIRGIFHPTFECGKTKDPAWIVFARARGANLTIDINNGDYVFMFLKL
ncbi:hypothetical protein HRM2_38630 [Desulforapulum autotrophicum HRM2]|uniref:DUF5619 domain-containing protein n=1 Tax=Desulforapulum autotrophicum (strain ATCC 43914 / DSM 3382 / VKM B-1955 / HRM2) TaxID=177437 RepID=C0QBB9_DESAH|nr:AF1514 family protein [Desulforapulum autotrophicum]ACN16921.1 hypothetical protein HRM2_38630 [Desulforapulum autotrophicum HRM2]